jgi:hypothetical protein
MITALTLAYLALFVGCALPQIVRLCRRKTSQDCSTWREWALLSGICLQFSVFLLTGVRDWRVLASPVASFLSISTLLALVYRYRRA